MILISRIFGVLACEGCNYPVSAFTKDLRRFGPGLARYSVQDYVMLPKRIPCSRPRLNVPTQRFGALVPVISVHPAIGV